MYFEGMFGLGDSLYQRAVIRELAGEHHLITPWPQLYADLPNVHCVKPPVTRLRTQAKNIARSAHCWVPAPTSVLQRITYAGHDGVSIIAALCDAFGVSRSARIDFSGPPAGFDYGKTPYMVVRPATVREEWRADARNPRPEYLALAVKAARAAGYRVISIADLEAGKEWLAGEPPQADITFHHGEMMLEELLALVAGAAGVIGGVGFLAPMAVAYRVPMLLVYGGWGYHNGPRRIFDARMDTSRIVQAIPDKFCSCRSQFHDCDRTISNIEGHIHDFLLRVAA